MTHSPTESDLRALDRKVAEGLVIGMTGSRSLASEADRANVYRFLDEARERFGEFALAHGCQPKGADGHAAAWAKERGVAELPFPPDSWTAKDLFARNGRIAEACDRLIAFWDGESRGTLDTMKRAAKLGKPVHDVLARGQGRERWKPSPELRGTR